MELRREKDMSIFISVILIILGFVFLIKGSDFFVDGASSVASILKIPTIIHEQNVFPGSAIKLLSKKGTKTIAFQIISLTFAEQ